MTRCLILPLRRIWSLSDTLAEQEEVGLIDHHVPLGPVGNTLSQYGLKRCTWMCVHSTSHWYTQTTFSLLAAPKPPRCFSQHTSVNISSAPGAWKSHCGGTSSSLPNFLCYIQLPHSACDRLGKVWEEECVKYKSLGIILFSHNSVEPRSAFTFNLLLSSRVSVSQEPYLGQNNYLRLCWTVCRLRRQGVESQGSIEVDGGTEVRQVAVCFWGKDPQTKQSVIKYDILSFLKWVLKLPVFAMMVVFLYCLYLWCNF